MWHVLNVYYVLVIEPTLMHLLTFHPHSGLRGAVPLYPYFTDRKTKCICPRSYGQHAVEAGFEHKRPQIKACALSPTACAGPMSPQERAWAGLKC